MLEQVQPRFSYLSPRVAAVNYTVYADRREGGFPARVLFEDGNSAVTGSLCLLLVVISPVSIRLQPSRYPGG